MAAPRNIDTKQLILDSTEKLIQQRQVEAISLQEIATEAGISKGTLYYYYTSKQLILIDLVEMYLYNLAQDFIEWIENKEKDTSLKRLIYFVLEKGAHNQRTKMHIYLINHALRDCNEDIRKKFRDNYKAWSNMLKATIEERVKTDDAELIADLLLAVIDGILIRELMGDNVLEVSKITDFFVNRLND